MGWVLDQVNKANLAQLRPELGLSLAKTKEQNNGGINGIS